MSTVFNAPPPDPRRERRRKVAVVAALAIIILGAVLWWVFRFYGEKQAVDRFFAALQQQQYERAYGIWMNDPEWKQHPDRYARYPYHEFYTDWGPGGEWGLIRSYEIEGARRPPGGGSGIIVIVTVNQRADKARIWVERDRTLGFSPF